MYAPPAPDLSRTSRCDAVDFCRGLALLIIFINHIPFNELSLYTPARFGFSDAAEIFIYCSGLVSALAFGRCFDQAGVGLGTVRVLHRCGQIYLAHLGLFISLAVVCLLGNVWLGYVDYIGRLNIHYFFDQTPDALLALASLTYVPNYFDILPMYLVILFWTPLIWILARWRRSLGLLAPVLIYAAMWRWGWELPADPVSDRPWFFNPFAWQLLFFTGVAFGAGWLQVAPGRIGLTWLAGAIVLLAIPLSYEPIVGRLEWLSGLRASLGPLLDKTHFGLLRGLHFLALAYLVYSWLQRRPDWLRRLPAVWLRKVGEHTLPIFLLGMNLSYVGGMLLDAFGHGVVVLAWVNIGGCAARSWRIDAGIAWGLAWSRIARAMRSLATGALLLLLSAAPLYLVNQYVMNLDARLQLSDSSHVLREPDMPRPVDAAADPPPEEAEPEQDDHLRI